MRESARTVLAQAACIRTVTQAQGVACSTDTQHRPGRAPGTGHQPGTGEERRRGRWDGDMDESCAAPWSPPASAAPVQAPDSPLQHQGRTDAKTIPKSAPAGTGDAGVVWKSSRCRGEEPGNCHPRPGDS